MELRQYWFILWKRIWIPILLIVVVAVVSLLTHETPPLIYTTSLRFVVGVKTQEAAWRVNEETFHAWVVSEYLADDLSVIVGSQEFATDVNRHLEQMNSSVRIIPDSITGITFGEKQHRILRVDLTWGNPDEIGDIGRAIVAALENDSPKYFAQLGTPDAFISSVIDKPLVSVPTSLSLTQRLDLPVRLVLALIAGIGLVFLLDYLDTSVRNAPELEEMGIPVLTEVPKQK